MMLPEKEQELRSIVIEIQIGASPEAVWKALTDPVELVRWFPPEARVDPGPGGRMWLSWGEPIVQDSRIEIWEPNRHLRTVEVRPLGAKLQPREVANLPRAVDYLLEQREGTIVFRLVHSGFPVGSDWDETYRAVHSGWEFQLRSIRHYLERHSGTQRSVALVRRMFRHSPEEVWDLLLGLRGLLADGSLAGVSEGDHYSIRAATGDALNGIIQICDPPHQFAATVTNMNDALFRITIVAIPTGATEASVWLAAYSLPEAEVKSFEQRWRDLLEDLSCMDFSSS